MTDHNRRLWPLKKQLASVPSYLGVMTFLMAGFGNSWWIGLPLFVAVVVAYDRLYDSVITPRLGKVQIALRVLGLVLFQTAYWAMIFLAANQLLGRGGAA